MAKIAELKLDLSKFHDELEAAKEKMSHKQYLKAMNKTFYDLKNRLRTPIWKAVQPEYNVKQGELYASLGQLKYKHGAVMQAWFDLKGVRKPIMKKATDSRPELISPAKGMRARLVKGAEKLLPIKGRRAHFRIKGKQRLVVFSGEVKTMMAKFNTENATEKKYSHKVMGFKRAVAISIPQMPLNRSAKEVENGMLRVAMERLNHNVNRVLSK